MPASNPEHIPAVLHFSEGLRPRTILDVGVGMGAYGFLLRQYLEVCYERIRRDQWGIKIDGIEVYPGYRNPVWQYAYDRVIIGDARTVLNGLGRYDLILCNDVLEHLRADDAREFIRRLASKAGAVIATTPVSFIEQGAWMGNEAERHLSVLKAADFPDLVASKRTGTTACYVSSQDVKTRRRVRELAATCPPVAKRPLSGAVYRARRLVRTIASRVAGVNLRAKL